MWITMLLSVLNFAVSNRRMFGDSLWVNVAIDTLKFVADSWQLIDKGEMSEEEMLDYWQALGVKIKASRRAWEEAREARLRELNGE